MKTKNKTDIAYVPCGNAWMKGKEQTWTHFHQTARRNKTYGFSKL